MTERIRISVDTALGDLDMKMSIMEQLLPQFEAWGYSVFPGTGEVSKHLVLNLGNPCVIGCVGTAAT